MSYIDKFQSLMKSAYEGSSGFLHSTEDDEEDTFSDFSEYSDNELPKAKFDRPMDSLVSVINKLQDVFQKVGDLSNEIKLPQIVVVGSQSSGKSSVLESIVRRDFLPRGTGIVTRCPLILQLTRKGKAENGFEEYGQFLHTGDKVFSDFGQIREEIIAQTKRIAGPNKGISSDPITLKIFSSRVVDLTLVDLPGITKVPVGDQPRDIENQVCSLVHKFIANENSIILAVSEATTDFANSESLKIARQVDPNGERTLAVLTKLDLMSAGTDAEAVLSGSVIPVKLGIIGCVNRSQKDIDDKKSIDDALKKERTFLEDNYPTMAKTNGTAYLEQELSKILRHHISKCLPKLKLTVTNLTESCQKQVDLYGASVTDKRSTALRILEKFSDAYCSAIKGTNQKLKTDSLDCGARICDTFYNKFSKLLTENKKNPKNENPKNEKKKLTPKEIMNAVKNIQGTHSGLFIPDAVFEQLVQDQISCLEGPSLSCVDMVKIELQRTIMHCNADVKQELERFPKMSKRINAVVNELISSRVEPTKVFVANLIKIEMTHIDARHPDFSEAKKMSENSNELLKGESGDYWIHMVHKDGELSEVDKKNVILIDFLCKKYYAIVHKTIQDLVPKAIMTFMVDDVKKNLKHKLLCQLFKDDLLDELLKESNETCTLRNKAVNKLKALKTAADIIDKLGNGQN